MSYSCVFHSPPLLLSTGRCLAMLRSQIYHNSRMPHTCPPICTGRSCCPGSYRTAISNDERRDRVVLPSSSRFCPKESRQTDIFHGTLVVFAPAESWTDESRNLVSPS